MNLSSKSSPQINNRGRQGVQGIQGHEGIEGVEGLKGDTGLTGEGIQGIQGIQGKTGENGIQGKTGGTTLLVGSGKRQSAFNLTALFLAIITIIALVILYSIQVVKSSKLLSISREQSKTVAGLSASVDSLTKQNQQIDTLINKFDIRNDINDSFYYIVCQVILSNPPTQAQINIYKNLKNNKVCVMSTPTRTPMSTPTTIPTPTH